MERRKKIVVTYPPWTHHGKTDPSTAVDDNGREKNKNVKHSCKLYKTSALVINQNMEICLFTLSCLISHFGKHNAEVF